MGIVKVVVNQGFEGFIKLTGEGFIDTFYQLQGPLNGDLANPAEVTMLSVSDVNEIARAASTEVNLQQSGVVVLELRDCLGDLSADVSVSSAESAEANLVYLEADLRKISAAKVTTSAGLVMAFDAPSGRNGFSLTRKTSSNSKVDLGKLDVSAIAGAITYAPHQLGR